MNAPRTAAAGRDAPPAAGTAAGANVAAVVVAARLRQPNWERLSPPPVTPARHGRPPATLSTPPHLHRRVPPGAAPPRLPLTCLAPPLLPPPCPTPATATFLLPPPPRRSPDGGNAAAQSALSRALGDGGVAVAAARARQCRPGGGAAASRPRAAAAARPPTPTSQRWLWRRRGVGSLHQGATLAAASHAATPRHTTPHAQHPPPPAPTSRA